MVGDLVPGLPMRGRAMDHAGSAATTTSSAARHGARRRFGMELALDAGGPPPALHDGDGYVDFGPAGGSYYYSRTSWPRRDR